MDTLSSSVWHQIMSKEMFRIAMFILRRGDLENRRKDAVKALQRALEYWPENDSARAALEELKQV